MVQYQMIKHGLALSLPYRLHYLTICYLSRRLLPPNLQLMTNSNLVYHVIDKQNWLMRRAFGRIIIVEDLTDEEDTVIEDNDS
jgi:hypothetical protein